LALAAASPDDQRARIYIADLIKSQRPEFSDARVAQAVNEQLGNYNRANWTDVQRQISKFVLFPGWDMSSLNWVIRHPVRTSLPPALLIWTANQALNALGKNRESEKNDFFAIHAGDRAFTTGLINEPLSRVAAGAPLRFAQALAEGKSPTRAAGEASRGLVSDVTKPLGMLRPDLGLAIELGTNRERIGSSKELYKSSDFSTPGQLLPHSRGCCRRLGDSRKPRTAKAGPISARSLAGTWVSPIIASMLNPACGKREASLLTTRSRNPPYSSRTRRPSGKCSPAIPMQRFIWRSARISSSRSERCGKSIRQKT
jgi:hypothetical protein